MDFILKAQAPRGFGADHLLFLRIVIVTCYDGLSDPRPGHVNSFSRNAGHINHAHSPVNHIDYTFGLLQSEIFNQVRAKVFHAY